MKLLVGFGCFLLVSEIQGQPNFSQFYSLPALSNPAQTGRFDDNFRVTGIYRIQKSTSSRFLSASLSFESRIMGTLLAESDRLAVGIVGSEEQNTVQGMKSHFFPSSIAYQKGLDEEGTQQLGIGFQTTLCSKSFTPSTIVFEDQMAGLLRAGITSFSLLGPPAFSVLYWDVNAGGVYQGRINDRNRFATGFPFFISISPINFLTAVT